MNKKAESVNTVTPKPTSLCQFSFLAPPHFGKQELTAVLFFPNLLRPPCAEATVEATAGTYLAHARSVLHLVDGPQETGWGRGRGGLQDPTEAGSKEGSLRSRRRRGPVFLLLG